MRLGFKGNDDFPCLPGEARSRFLSPRGKLHRRHDTVLPADTPSVLNRRPSPDAVAAMEHEAFLPLQCQRLMAF